MKLAHRLVRKAIPIGCKETWWYLNPNGSISIYGTSYNGEKFSCEIPKRSLKVLRRNPMNSNRK